MVWPASAGDCCLSGLWAGDCGYGCRLSTSPSGVAVGDISAPLMPWALSEIFSGQSWPLLDLTLLWIFSGLVQVLSCLALSVPVGVRSVLSPVGFSSLWLCLVERI